MKKKYLISLDEEKVDELKAWLKKRGISSFSGYLNTLIDEQLEAIKLFAPRGDTSKVTTKTLLTMASRMVKDLKK
jgi:hypothetical protein